ncbi:MAG: 1,4-Dihydroxy-2-naphthoyl-CoA synthase [Frankiales bacterium]|jgi:dihydroxynaphthoic acid synthetase|nr:1,4-Dihydroxy-2-naphthoyl-CoA synthase [Frankiales bacterium]
MSDEVLFDVADGVARITLNRPERLNAFTLDGARRMRACFEEATNDRSVGVVVLTGTGDRAFCTGGDVGDFAEFTIDVDRAMNAELLRLSHEMRTGGKPIIARVNGYCMGAGNELNMQCDLTVAADHAQFGQTGPKMGSTPNWWVTQLLPRSVGEKRAREIVYLCNRYTAQQAEEMGWVNRVVPADQLDAAVDEWCQSLLEKSPTALRLAKMAINQASDQLSGAVTQGMELITFFHDTDESREGMQAFVEKRKPVFRPQA